MKWSVKQRLLTMISVLILFSVLLVTALTYQHDRRDLVAQSNTNTQALLEQLRINLDSYLDELFRLCLSPYYSRQVMNEMEKTPETSLEALHRQRVIEDYLSGVMTLPRSDVLRAVIFSQGVFASSKTQTMPSFSEYEKERWYQDAMEKNETIFLPAHTEQAGRGELEIFSVVKRINSMNDSSRPIGAIRIDANYRGIKTVCEQMNLPEGAALMIMDENQQQIYWKKGAMAEEAVKQAISHLDFSANGSVTISMDGQNYVANTKLLSATKWRIIDIRPTRLLTASAENARNRAFLMAFLCAGLGMALCAGLVRVFLRPVGQMTRLMREAQAGDLSVRASIEGHDEFSYLGDSFNHMLSQIQTQNARNDLLTRQVYEARYLEKEAQYAALCNQIQPHFLFNALNTIHLLIKMNRSEEADQCISMLATLLRGIVDSDKEISLAEEIKIVTSYLALQKKRYPNLDYSIPDISDYAECRLPALSIQPLIENALKHGCEAKPGEAKIELSIRATEAEMAITVRDNGTGMDAEKVQALQKSLERTSGDIQKSENGVGLINISRRVRLKYGEAYGLSIQSALGEGTSVTLRLPASGGERASVEERSKHA